MALFIILQKKHIDRYIDEFCFILNGGNVRRHTLERIESMVSGFVGTRLSYKELIGEVGINVC